MLLGRKEETIMVHEWIVSMAKTRSERFIEQRTRSRKSKSEATMSDAFVHRPSLQRWSYRTAHRSKLEERHLRFDECYWREAA